MQFTIDTDRDDFRRARALLYAAYGKELEADNSGGKSNGNGSHVLPGGWTEKKLRKWAQYLQPDAQVVVAYVAGNAPEVDYDDVAQYLAEFKGLDVPVDGKALGGAMSSGGHALNHISGVKSQPIDRDHNNRRYIIDERVADILIDELGDPDEWDDDDWDEE